MTKFSRVPEQLQLFGESFEYAVTLNGDTYFVSPYLDIAKIQARKIYLKACEYYCTKMENVIFGNDCDDRIITEPNVAIYDLDSMQLVHAIN